MTEKVKRLIRKNDIQLITEADIPNCNGIIYTSEAMIKMAEKINEKWIPITFNYYRDRNRKCVNIKDIIGFAVPGTARFDGKHIHVDLKLDKIGITLLDNPNFNIGSNIICQLDGDKIIDEGIEVIHLAIFNNDEDRWIEK